MSLEEVMAALLIAYAVALIGGAFAYHLIVKHKTRKR